MPSASFRPTPPPHIILPPGHPPRISVAPLTLPSPFSLFALLNVSPGPLPPPRFATLRTAVTPSPPRPVPAYTFPHLDFPPIPHPPLQPPCRFLLHARRARSLASLFPRLRNTAACLSWSLPPLTSPHLPFPPRHPTDPFRPVPPRRAASLALVSHPRRLPATSLPHGALTSIRPLCRFLPLPPPTFFCPAPPCHAPSFSHPFPLRIPAPLLHWPSPSPSSFRFAHSLAD